MYFVLETLTLHPATSVYSNYSKFVLEVGMLDMSCNKSIANLLKHRGLGNQCYQGAAR